MTELNQNISDKTIWNAISAYLMIFISWLFLFNKSNPEINNSFVKNHTKTAMLIHLWFLITYIIFISNWIFASYNVMWFWINNIITDVIYIWLLFLLANWIYKAKNKQIFNIWNWLNISNQLLDIDWDWKISEKEKITILLSYVPLIWFIDFAKNKTNLVIQNWIRLNILISIIISLLLIFWYINLATFFSLIYIIFVTFIWINLFTRNELISINLPNIFSPSNLYINCITLQKYIKNYFSNEQFKSFELITKEIKESNINENINNKAILESKKELKLPKFLIYTPFLNLIFLFYKNTKYSFHIINGLIITLTITLLLLISILWYININLILLLLFPIFFWIWYVNNKLEYKMPIIFDIYILFKNMFSIFKSSSKKIKEKKAEENDLSLKVNK